MNTWILRFSLPRQKPSDPRQLSVLQRGADGGITELGTIAIESRQINLPDVVEEQVRQGRTRLVLDLSQERKVDSNDLAQIVGAMKYASDAGGELIFANANARVLEILRLTHLDDVMAVYDSIGAAAEHFATDA